MKDNRKKRLAVFEILTVILFFCGVALIAAGLWSFCQPLALVFLGVACLYVSACTSNAANSHERTDKK